LVVDYPACGVMHAHQDRPAGILSRPAIFPQNLINPIDCQEALFNKLEVDYPGKTKAVL
jgi:hypothetical protein